MLFPRCPFILPFLLLAMMNAPARAQVDVDRLKLGYTLHFISHVHWQNVPARANEITLCSFREARLGREMIDSLDKRSVGGMTMATRGLNLANPQIAGCDLLFIPAALGDHAASLLARSSSAGVLTISDIEDFCDKGGIIGFVVDGDRLRFDIDLQAAARQNLRFSAKLLELARKVRR